jgi:hypothetical protein
MIFFLSLKGGTDIRPEDSWTFSPSWCKLDNRSKQVRDLDPCFVTIINPVSLNLCSLPLGKVQSMQKVQTGHVTILYIQNYPFKIVSILSLGKILQSVNAAVWLCHVPSACNSEVIFWIIGWIQRSNRRYFLLKEEIKMYPLTARSSHNSLIFMSIVLVVQRDLVGLLESRKVNSCHFTSLDARAYVRK